VGFTIKSTSDRDGAATGANRRAAAAMTFLRLSAMCLPLLLLSYVGEVRIIDWPLDVSGFPAFRDFANLWAGGHAGLSGQFDVLFDRAAHRDEVARLLDVPPSNLMWSYPPTTILLVTPLALLPYGWAVAAWTIGGVAAYLAAAGDWRREWSSPARLLAIALAPGVFLCVMYGQTTLLTAAALAAGISQARTRPWIAGAALAMLAAKPHAALIVPVALVALGAWRAFFATGVWVAAFCAATLLMFGVEPWRLFLDVTLEQQVAVMTAQKYSVGMMISPYFFGRGLGLTTGEAGVLQALVAVWAFAWMFASVKVERDPNIRFLLIACAALLASPYLQLYELPLLVLAVARVLSSRASIERIGNCGVMALAAAVTIVPFVTLCILTKSGVNAAPLIPVAILLSFGLAAIRSRRDDMAIIGMAQSRA
jgi:alpha-1,2-mannosyltransferase